MHRIPRDPRNIQTSRVIHACFLLHPRTPGKPQKGRLSAWGLKRSTMSSWAQRPGRLAQCSSLASLVVFFLFFSLLFFFPFIFFPFYFFSLLFFSLFLFYPSMTPPPLLSRVCVSSCRVSARVVE
ncbi:hypothetical protein VUR80DRAFT_5101 [Thermomyces stellatus]